MSTELPTRSISVLIAALGGEGGGVMADWLVEAATQCGLPVQATSIPGVAQRTGATTYYLEIFPARRDTLGGREPVMSLTPNPGNVDIMISSEFMEAGRAMQNGYVSPDRTTLIASTHRIYSTGEKMQMGDGRFDSAKVYEAARQLARRAVLFDMREIAQANGTVINAVLFGAMAGSGALPLPRAACEAAIRSGGRGAEASLRGFAAGFDLASAAAKPAPATPDKPVLDVLALGEARLVDYQGPAYAKLYRERMQPFLGLDARLAEETGRHLALWMSFEDIIRVADLKTRAARFARVRKESRAGDNEPLVIVDYLKPGIEEFASLLPPALGRRLVDWAEKSGRMHAYNIGMHVRTTTVLGYLMVRSLAWLKPWRPHTYRYHVEQQHIDAWLGRIREAARRDTALALEIAECATLIKGYSDTHRRGMANFLALMDALVDNPATADPREQAAAIARARQAALADPEGKALSSTLGTPLANGKPVFWLAKSP
ncbi:MAG: 2-oxoacid:acceptor oxidoreductase family protein [Proteobacteria bacterium]|nr:2-oxoacid:acceptor oxidoreductase family protein [Pseudomonadota bacterium]